MKTKIPVKALYAFLTIVVCITEQTLLFVLRYKSYRFIVNEYFWCRLRFGNSKFAADYGASRESGGAPTQEPGTLGLLAQ